MFLTLRRRRRVRQVTRAATAVSRELGTSPEHPLDVFDDLLHEQRRPIRGAGGAPKLLDAAESKAWRDRMEDALEWYGNHVRANG